MDPKNSATEKKGRRSRFVFNVERDIILLESALNLNPWQLGTEKWGEVSEDFARKIGTVVKERTLRDRISHLILKHEKEEKETKTGTEEQRSKRGALLREIIALKNAEMGPINKQIGADDDLADLDSDDIDLEDVVSVDENVNLTKKPKKVNERSVADAERDNVLKANYSEVPPDHKTSRTKRTKAAMEEDLIIEKARHDMIMEEKRMRLDETVKLGELNHEDKRLEIELLREKILADENQQRGQLFEALQKSLEIMQKVMEKHL